MDDGRDSCAPNGVRGSDFIDVENEDLAGFRRAVRVLVGLDIRAITLGRIVLAIVSETMTISSFD